MFKMMLNINISIMAAKNLSMIADTYFGAKTFGQNHIPPMTIELPATTIHRFLHK
jgi:hypothetical protein